MRTQRCTAAALALLALPSTLAAASLRGSSDSLAIQARMARQHDYTYLRTSSQVKDFAAGGLLVELAGNRDYTLADVSFPYARAEVRTFVERLGRQYRAACGERQATRPCASISTTPMPATSTASRAMRAMWALRACVCRRASTSCARIGLIT